MFACIYVVLDFKSRFMYFLLNAVDLEWSINVVLKRKNIMSLFIVAMFIKHYISSTFFVFPMNFKYHVGS